MAKSNTSIKSLHHLHIPRKAWVVLSHLIIVMLLFVVPEVLLSLTRPREPHAAGIYLKSLMWVAVFYSSYYLTCDPTDGQRKTLMKYVVQNVVLFVLAIVAMYFVWNISTQWRPVPPPEPGRMFAHHRPGGPSMVFLIRDGIVVILTIVLSLTLKFIDRFRIIDQQQREYRARAREAELQRLKGQLNPHFLFNTLNGIYALIEIAPERAQKAIHKLSRMLRYVLYENPSAVTLGSELEFVDNYVELMKLRLPKSIGVEANVDGGDCVNNMVCPMLFINLIENAFKHGTKSETPGPIRIDICVEEKVLKCRISNCYDPKASSSSGGIGLVNLRRRLELQYANRFSLKIKREERFEVEMDIDISAPPEFVSEKL